MKIDMGAIEVLFSVLAISCLLVIVAESKLLNYYSEKAFVKWSNIRRKAMVFVAVSGLALVTVVVAHGLDRNNNVPWPVDNSANTSR